MKRIGLSSIERANDLRDAHGDAIRGSFAPRESILSAISLGDDQFLFLPNTKSDLEFAR